MKKFEKTTSEELETKKIEAEIFSEEDVNKINKITDYDDKINDIEKNIDFLSGRKRREAEDDLRQCKERRQESMGLAKKNVRQLDGINKLINPEDLEYINRKNELTPAKMAEMDDKTRQRYNEALSREAAFFDRLYTEFDIDASVGMKIFRETLLEGASKEDDDAREIKVNERKQKEQSVDYEYFDPEEEIEKIMKFDWLGEALTPEERMAIKKQRLAEYKKNLADQKAGIAKINADIEEMVLKSETIDKEKLDDYLMKQARTYKLSPVQLKKYALLNRKIEKRNQTIDKYSHELDQEGKNEFFRKLFGKEAVGKIEIQRGALSFFIICNDPRDYLFITENRSETNKAVAIAETKSAGYANMRVNIHELQNAVTAANKSAIEISGTNVESYMEKTRTHEEKHVLNGMIREIEELDQYQKEPRKDEHMLKKMIKEKNLQYGKRAKDEILSFFKERKINSEEIKSVLLKKQSDGGSYDYFGEDKAFRLEYNFFDPDEVDKAYEKAEEIYKNNINRGVEILDHLEKIGFDRGKIIGIFQTESLGQWDKVYDRFKNSEEFKEKKQKAVRKIDNELEQNENKIKQYEDNINKMESNVFKRGIHAIKDRLESFRNKLSKNEYKSMTRHQAEKMYLDWAKKDRNVLILKKEKLRKYNNNEHL